MNEKYYAAIHTIIQRYITLVAEDGGPEQYPELWPFMFKALFHARDEDLPLMKLNRWLGYIQGTVISAGLTTIEDERDWTRPLLRPLDFSDE